MHARYEPVKLSDDDSATRFAVFLVGRLYPLVGVIRFLRRKDDRDKRVRVRIPVCVDCKENGAAPSSVDMEKLQLEFVVHEAFVTKLEAHRSPGSDR